MTNILVVDDEIGIEETFRDIFFEEIERGYYNFDFARDGQEALIKIKSKPSNSIDLLLVDVRMAKIDGLTLIEGLKQENIEIKTIIISALVKPEEISYILQNNEHVVGFLSKPINNIEKLKNIIQENTHSLTQMSLGKAFDYSSLDGRDSQFIQEQTGEIRSLMRRTAQSIIEIGQILIEVKKRLGHGRFGDWLKVEFDWSEPTAQRFMQVAREFKSINLTNLNIAPSALYVLAAPSTPASARVEAIERASSGEAVSYTIAKEIKEKYTKSPDKVKSEKCQKTKEAPAPNSEIISIIPKETTRQTKVPIQKKTPSLAAIPAKEPGSWWQLGQEHLLYCGVSNSPEFKQRLPEKIALSLAFPHTPDWRLDIPTQANSEVAFFTRYQDQDLKVLREAIERLLLLYTESSEAVVISFLPDPKLLLLAHKLGCRCFIAEPDAGRCEAAIATWQKIGACIPVE